MDVVSVSALRAASLVWQPRPSTWMLTVVAKATFALAPGESTLAREQEAPNEEDDHWDDNPARSVRAPSEMSPVKPHAEVVLVGHAFAPGRVAARSVVARLVVGDLDKSIEVFCDRWLGTDGSIQEGARFLRMPLRYERAAGGPGTWNPIGVRADAREATGRRPMPNLQAVGDYVKSFDAAIEPAGFGPLAPTWPTRVEKLGHHAASFAGGRWRERPLPDGIDFAYFNVAPPGQQVAQLRGNERIILENLHPEHAVLTTTLPGIRPAAFADSGRRSAPRMAMHADTLLIETDQAIATITWRGTIPLDRPDQPGRIVIGMESPGQEVTWAEVERASGARRSSQSQMLPQAEEPRAAARRPMFETRDEGTVADLPIPGMRSTIPFAGAPVAAPREATVTARAEGLPFQAAPPAAEPRSSRPGGGGLPFQSTQAPPATPPWSQPAPSPPASSAKPSAQEMPAYHIPAPPPSRGSEPTPAPAWVPPPSPISPPPIAAPPGAAQGLSASGPSLPPSVNLMAAAAAAAAVTATSAAESAPERGALSASNTAAAASTAWSVPKRDLRAIRPDLEPIPDARTGARELLQLVWFDPEAAPRIRRVERWKPVLDELERRPPDRAIDAIAAGKDPFDAEDMREVFEILARGAQTDARGMDESLRDAIQDDGKFLPPLVLVAGDIETPFDEIESLKAAVAAASPVVTPTEEALKTALSGARDLMQSSPPPPPSVAEAATVRLRETFVREKKALPADHLDAQMERLLLAGRHYQKREVLGGSFLRVLLWMPAEQSPLLAYVPADLAKKLPMYRRTKARLIAEVHPAQDQYEAQPHALRVLAIARAGGAAPRT